MSQVTLSSCLLLQSTAAASDTTSADRLSDTMVIGIPTILVSMLAIIVTVVVAICGCYRKKHKNGSKCMKLYCTNVNTWPVALDLVYVCNRDKPEQTLASFPVLPHLQF